MDAVLAGKKTCLITGANAGIGREAAVHIAAAGYHVVLACRSPERGEAALREVRERAGNDAADLRNVTGKCFDEGNRQVRTNRRTYDPEHVERVMDLTLRYLSEGPRVVVDG